MFFCHTEEWKGVFPQPVRRPSASSPRCSSAPHMCVFPAFLYQVKGYHLARGWGVRSTCDHWILPGLMLLSQRAAGQQRLGSTHMTREWLQLLSLLICNQSPRDTHRLRPTKITPACDTTVLLIKRLKAAEVTEPPATRRQAHREQKHTHRC